MRTASASPAPESTRRRSDRGQRDPDRPTPGNGDGTSVQRRRDIVAVTLEIAGGPQDRSPRLPQRASLLRARGDEPTYPRRPREPQAPSPGKPRPHRDRPDSAAVTERAAPRDGSRAPGTRRRGPTRGALRAPARPRRTRNRDSPTTQGPVPPSRRARVPASGQPGTKRGPARTTVGVCDVTVQDWDVVRRQRQPSPSTRATSPSGSTPRPKAPLARANCVNGTYACSRHRRVGTSKTGAAPGPEPPKSSR